MLATLTNSQPEHRGAAELGTTVMVRNDTTFLVTYCHSADPSVWFFCSFTDGGGGYGRCDEGAKELPPPDLPLLACVSRRAADDGTHVRHAALARGEGVLAEGRRGL